MGHAIRAMLGLGVAFGLAMGVAPVAQGRGGPVGQEPVHVINTQEILAAQKFKSEISEAIADAKRGERAGVHGTTAETRVDNPLARLLAANADNPAALKEIAAAVAKTNDPTLITNILTLTQNNPTIQAALATAVVSTGNVSVISAVIVTLKSVGSTAAVTALNAAVSSSGNPTLIAAVQTTVATIQTQVAANTTPTIILPNPNQVINGSKS